VTTGVLGSLQTSSYEVFSSLGNGALLNVSTDAISWTTRTTTLGISRIDKLTSSSSYYVASGSDYVSTPGVITVSTNNIVWSLRTAGVYEKIVNTVYFGGDRYLIGATNPTPGNTAIVSVSTDTINWSLRTTISGYTSANTFVYDGTRYVGGFSDSSGNTLISVSTDTIVWTSRTSAYSEPNYPISDISYNGANLYVAGHVSPPGIGIIQTSTNSIVWILRTAPGGGVANQLYANNLYIAGGESGRNLVSTDGVIWTARTSGTSGTITGLSYGNNTFVYSSPSGILGTATRDSLTNFGDGAKIITSTDLISWTLRTGPFNIQQLNYVSLGSEYYVASFSDYLNRPGIISSSTNAIIWILRTTGIEVGTSVNSIKYYQEDYFITGDNGLLTTSTDSITWTSRTTGLSNEPISDILYSDIDSTYILSSTSGSFAVSTDSISWTLRTSGYQF
jgi:hypothetical protein